MTDLDRWRADPVSFVSEVLIDAGTGAPFDLYPAQVQFLRAAFTVGLDGRLPAPEIVFGASKKAGKTALGAMCVLYVVLVLAGPYGEAFVVANDEEQAKTRVFTAIERIIKASPKIRDSARITAKIIEFTSTGATITAIANDYAGAAGSNAHIVCFDELWAYTSESSRRLWDEMVPPPTRHVTCRLTTTYAGFEGESALLEGLYKRGMKGKEIAPRLFQALGLLMAWHHEPIAPWQTPQWLEEMRLSLRPNQFLRMIENRFVSNESSFVDMDWWDGCIDHQAVPSMGGGFPVWVGLDASTKRDQTAIVTCRWDRTANKVQVLEHRIFRPSKANPLDFETTIERSILELSKRFRIRSVRYDPWNMPASAQRLMKAGVHMEEFTQTTDHLTAMGTNLYELIKSRNLVMYPDDEVRLAVSRAVAIETPRGWKISKEKTSHKIDVVVALAMAALGAVESGQSWGTATEYLRQLVPSCPSCEYALEPTDTKCPMCQAEVTPTEEEPKPEDLLDAREFVPMTVAPSEFGRRRALTESESAGTSSWTDIAFPRDGRS